MTWPLRSGNVWRPWWAQSNSEAVPLSVRLLCLHPSIPFAYVAIFETASYDSGMPVSRMIGAAVPFVLMASNGPDASPQARPTPPPAGAEDRIAIVSADVSRYEAMYGPGEFRTLDEEAANWPK